MSNPDDLRARAQVVLADRSDWTWARQGTVRAVVRDLLAAIDDLHRPTAPAAPALTVGAFLAFAHVAEFHVDDEWWQVRPGAGMRTWRVNAVNGPRWSEWWSNAWDPAQIEDVPCRLVPVDLADRDPSERGAL